ncbi:PQQ-binding-like beta-propeller repeat protein [Cognatitamlana onchidii]|uniref:PQQ-binding-like beta-propeller repeat protein n=1 Tax=Cognatitamlana onchidii TaxID=2562860 RepID=UPI0010A5BAB2|nr:PQQ-binding-like beta-propeller repeat protein [Algibacter onchidii]
MRFFFISLTLLVLTFSCTNSKSQRTKLLDFAPSNASIIIKANNIESLKNGINNNDFLQRFSKTSTYQTLQSKIENLSILEPTSDIVLCFSNNALDSLEYSVITRFHENLIQKDSLTDYMEEVFKFDTKTITKSTLKGNSFYSTIIDSTFFSSSSKKLVEAIFTKDEKYETLHKIFNTTSDNKTFSIGLKPNGDFIKSLFIEDSLALSNFTEYIVADVELNQNDIYFNGITKAEDSINSLINVFKNTVPQENHTYKLAPSNCDGFMSFTFDDFTVFQDNLAKYHNKDTIAGTPSLFNDIIEIGIIYEDEKRGIILNSIDVIATTDELLKEQTTVGSYRGIEIFNFSNPVLFAKTFHPFITYNSANVYCIIDNFFVFADTISMLQNIISSYQNKTTLADRAYFESSREKLSDASSLLQIVNTSSLKSILGKNLDNINNYKLNGYEASGIQFIYDNNFAHVNGIIKRAKTEAKANSVSEHLNIKLSNDILTSPQFVTNHVTRQKEVVVQDIKNNLYLISNKGKVLWKKQLPGRILGKIEQIDMFRNGRLQLAFATKNRVYVLDRNGKTVKPFPLKFKDDITQPLAIFDYEKRKNYRLLVTQGRHVLMYSAKGKIVKGFGFSTANSKIIAKPKHFRIGSKDYITLKTKNKIYILDRIGKTRVKTNSSYKYSSQPIFLYQNTFTTTTDNGSLISIDTRGRITEKPLNLSKNHFLETSSKTLITQDENTLSIKNKSTELDFGDYSTPKLFYINDKIYITTTDLQSNKVYVFDSQSQLLPNFPVYGNSTIDLSNIDKDKNLEFVTKGEHNSLIVYQLN